MKKTTKNANGVTVPAAKAANTGRDNLDSGVEPKFSNWELIARTNGPRRISLSRAKKLGTKEWCFRVSLSDYEFHDILEEEGDCGKAIRLFLGHSLYVMGSDQLARIGWFFEAEREAGQAINENDPDHAFFEDLRDQIDSFATGFALRAESTQSKS